MLTELVQRTYSPFAVTKYYHIGPEQPDTPRSAASLLDLLDHASRHPVLAHELPHRRVVLDTAQKIVLLSLHCNSLLSRALRQLDIVIVLICVQRVDRKGVWWGKSV